MKTSKFKQQFKKCAQRIMNKHKKRNKTKFFTFNQNNSGGDFVHDKKHGIGHYVIIEAENYHEANHRAEDIGLYFDGAGDCTCCGNRWSEKYPDDDGTDVPVIYGTDVSKLKYPDRWGIDSYIHYMDGTIKRIKGE